jgi:hypothetical protein
MRWDKDVTLGCSFIVAVFVSITFILPYVSIHGVNSDMLSAKVLSWIFIALVLILAVVFIPQLMFVWFGIPIIAILAMWFFGGELSGVCVPIVPGYCE